MLNSSSISSAIARVKPVWFGVAYLVGIFLYWVSFSGTPVWDDTTFWFFDPNFAGQTYSSIWKFSAWPVSIALQKFLLSLAGYKWWVYHSINFIVHGFNAWLVYVLLRTIGLRVLWSYAAFVLFLIHPASVISVAWMIQLKTLICFTFGIGALILFFRRRYIEEAFVAYALFFLSVMSKSASLPLPVVLLFFLEKPFFRKKNLMIIPFFIIALYGAYRINFSNVALEGVKDALETTGKGFRKTKAPVRQEEEAQVAEEFKALPDEPMVKPGAAFEPKDVEYHPPEKGAAAVEPTKTLVELSPVTAKRRLFIKTLYYYFWQAFVPMDNAPVKGQNPQPPGAWDYVHLIFLSFLILISARFYFFYLLAAGHILLLPYLGLIPAPYMNVTWVSDQHLYLALPFLLALFLCLFDRVKFVWKGILVVILIIFFAVKTKEAASYYRDNTAFYRTSIDHNFNNIPLVYNLAIIYVSEGKKAEALELLDQILAISRSEPYLIENKYFPYLIHLNLQLTGAGKAP